MNMQAKAANKTHTGSLSYDKDKRFETTPEEEALMKIFAANKDKLPTNSDILAALSEKEIISKISKIENIGKIIDKINKLIGERRNEVNTMVGKGLNHDLRELTLISKAYNRGEYYNNSLSDLSDNERQVVYLLADIEVGNGLKDVLEAPEALIKHKSPSKNHHMHANEEVITQEFQTYTIQADDTLSKIASRYNISWQELYKKNRATIGNDPGKIMIGDMLVIPNPGSQQEYSNDQRNVSVPKDRPKESEQARTAKQARLEQKAQSQKQDEPGRLETGKKYVYSRIEAWKSWFSSEETPEKEWPGEKLPFSQVISSGVERSSSGVTLCSRTALKNAINNFGVDLPRGNARDAVSKEPIDKGFVKTLTPHSYFDGIKNKLNRISEKNGVNFCDVDVESNTPNGRKYGHRVVMFKPDNIDYRYVLDPYKKKNLGETEPKLAKDYFGSHKLYKINTYKANKRVYV